MACASSSMVSRQPPWLFPSDRERSCALSASSKRRLMATHGLILHDLMQQWTPDCPGAHDHLLCRSHQSFFTFAPYECAFPMLFAVHPFLLTPAPPSVFKYPSLCCFLGARNRCCKRLDARSCKAASDDRSTSAWNRRYKLVNTAHLPMSATIEVYCSCCNQSSSTSIRRTP